MALLKFTRKDGEGYRSELQEYKEVRIMVEDVMKSNSKVRESLEFNNSISMDKLTHSLTDGIVNADSKPYDEWESIQRELALYPEGKDKEDGYNTTVNWKRKT